MPLWWLNWLVRAIVSGTSNYNSRTLNTMAALWKMAAKELGNVILINVLVMNTTSSDSELALGFSPKVH